MSDFLVEMSEASLLRARAARERADATGLDSRAASAPPPVPLGIASPGFDVIAEVKIASPSEGALLQTGADGIVPLAQAYESHGAAAISVLTEPSRFSGSLQHLEAVSREVSVPVMRKDFLVDPIQVVEARAAGASGVLLIARMLPGQLLAEMTDLAISLGMFVLLEVFDVGDLEIAAEVFDRDVLVGVNCRDLVTLGIDDRRFEALAPHLPNDRPAVAESGMSTTEQLAGAAALGYRMALVGSSLVSDADPAAKLQRLIEAGRRALTGVSR